MGLCGRRAATFARLGAAALTLVAAAAALRASPAGQAPPPPPQQTQPSGQLAPPPGQQAPPAGQQRPGQQPPVFRAGVRIVRVDVSVTGKGDKPVADLTADDFEVFEDGVPQKVEQLQFVRLDGRRPSGDETSLEIRSQEQAEAEAARDDVRVFAIFLDDYHIDKAPQITMPMRQGLALFVNRLWPTDLVAIMEPLTTLSALRFTRSKADLLAVVNKFEGRQGEFFPIKSVMEEAQLMRGDVRRVRAQVTFSALAALTMKLGGMREGRKSIIFVSQGPPTYLGSRDGNLQDEMRTIVEAANRGNVAIYPLDPTGLSMEMRVGDKGTLYQLAAETGGRTIVNTNNLAGGLERVFADNTAYYVLGYSPTRTEDDGKYHSITVKVKRSGTRVLARQGYFAPSSKELTAAADAAAKTLEPRVAGALDALAERQPGKRPVDVWVGMSRGAEGRSKVVVAWDPVEPDTSGRVESLDVAVMTAPGVSAVPVPEPSTPGAGTPARVAAAFEVAPGPFSMKYTARAGDQSTMDTWTQSLTAPDWGASALAISTPRFFVARSLPELRAIRASPDPPPSAVRQFRRSDRVLVAVECYTLKPDAAPVLQAHILTREGQELTALPVPALESGAVRFELPVGSLGQGTYILRVRATLGAEQAEEMTAIVVAR
ncbi:MAG: VWA domain-containing protein [Vicinamibacterales bacterium]